MLVSLISNKFHNRSNIKLHNNNKKQQRTIDL